MPLLSFSQITIRMEEDGGVYKVPCEVNGLRMKFIFDTGASSVCLSLAEARFMLENDYITSEDILGNSKSQIADGSIVENTKVRLKEIKIAGLVLKDVDAVVTHSIGAPLLLGQSAIQKLGTIQINGNELTILEHSNNVSEEYIDGLVEKANKYLDNRSYVAASKVLQELYDLKSLSDYGVYELATSYYFTDMYDKAILYYKGIKDFTHINKQYYYGNLGWCYIMTDEYNEAIYCFELQGENSGETFDDLFDCKGNLAIAYKLKGDYYNASIYFNALLGVWVKKEGMTIEEALKKYKKGKLKDDRYEKYLYELCYCQYMNNGRPIQGAELLVELAKHGNKYALKFVSENNLDELLYY